MRRDGMREGDLLFLYIDGVTEALDAANANSAIGVSSIFCPEAAPGAQPSGWRAWKTRSGTSRAANPSSTRSPACR
jgi:hypothetical protein